MTEDVYHLARAREEGGDKGGAAAKGKPGCLAKTLA